MSTFPVPSKVPELSTQQDMLTTALHIRHSVRASHERGEFSLLHNHPRSRSPPRTTIETPHPTESTQKRPYTAKYPTQYTSQTTPSLHNSRTTPNRVFNGPSLRETPPTNQPTETVKSRTISLEILLHAQRQTIMRQGRSTKTVPVYISVFIHQRHAVTGRMLFDPFR